MDEESSLAINEAVVTAESWLLTVNSFSYFFTVLVFFLDTMDDWVSADELEAVVEKWAPPASEDGDGDGELAVDGWTRWNRDSDGGGVNGRGAACFRSVVSNGWADDDDDAYTWYSLVIDMVDM